MSLDRSPHAAPSEPGRSTGAPPVVVGLLAVASVAVVVGAIAILSASCTADRATPTRTVTVPEPDPTATTSAASDASTTSPTTIAGAPPSTRPLTTAPPSPLLDEVVAAYDAAYADLLAAGAIPDENDPRLDDHMDPGQADQWRSVIRGLADRGERVGPGTHPSFRRVEGAEISPTSARLEVCRLDTETVIDASGATISSSPRVARYVESFILEERGWLWSGRDWVDASPYASDCALQ